jgi:hypothetical protein
VNGTPLLIDGWLADDYRTPFDPKIGMDFSFGLENLDFSGSLDGNEIIEVDVHFFSGEMRVDSITLRRNYVALRDAPTEVIRNDHGSFVWVGKYQQPEVKDKFEIFSISTTDVKEARAIKARIDKAQLKYNGRPALGVVRPPLDASKWYGVVIGLEQMNGQVQFTFDEATSKQLCQWLISLRADKKDPISRNVNPFRYEMEPRKPHEQSKRLCKALKQ